MSPNPSVQRGTPPVTYTSTPTLLSHSRLASAPSLPCYLSLGPRDPWTATRSSSSARLAGTTPHKILLIVFGMVLHPFSEGMDVCISFGGEQNYILNAVVLVSLVVQFFPRGPGGGHYASAPEGVQGNGVYLVCDQLDATGPH